MDINLLLRREQIALMLARVAATPEARVTQERLAGLYGASLRKIAFRRSPVRG